MTQFAILLTGHPRQPRAVRLVENAAHLTLANADGTESHIPWWRLFRISDEGTTHRFARLGERDWELRVTSGADRQLLARIGKRPLARIVYPLRRLHFFKTVFGSVVLFAAIAQHFPPAWTASAIPQSLQHRLVDAEIAQNAARRCSRDGGEEALRELLVRLDPELGPSVEIVGFNEGAFLVTAAPANKLVVTREALQRTDPETMAALLAHQLSHLRHGDPIVAMVRHEGTWGIWGAVLEGRLSNGLKMNYSGIEERRADVEAMTMLRRARIAIEPAARFFEEVRVSRAQNSFVAYEYRDFHFGIDSPAKRWATAASQQVEQDVRPALDRERSDALFNFCWPGAIPPRRLPLENIAPRPTPPGTGGINSAPAIKVP